MASYAVVYWSGTGNTEAMAEAIAKGIEATGNEGKVLTSGSFSADDLGNYDGFAFGCSSSGAETLEESEFEPMWNGVLDGLKGKKVVLFGSYGWGGGAWMDTWKSDAEEAGVSIMETAICENAPDDDVLSECETLGKTLVG